jgi:hypothetical protein
MREETSISEDGSRSDALLGTASWCLALAALILVASSVVQVIGYEGARLGDRFYLAGREHRDAIHCVPGARGGAGRRRAPVARRPPRRVVRIRWRGHGRGRDLARLTSARR